MRAKYIILSIILTLTKCQKNTDKERLKIIENLLKTPIILKDDLLDFTLKSRYKNIHSKNSKQIIPLKIQIKYPEINVEKIRTALDLILIIDISGSMTGEKIKLVKKTLIFIIDQLSSIDRLGLVTFNQSVNVLSKMKFMTNQNKILYKNLVNNIYARGLTNIVDGLKNGLEMLIDRENDFERESINAIFFLSDGQDTVGNTLIGLQEVLLEQNEILKNKEVDYIIHSFGFGAGHDEDWLTKISNFKNGNFYYIRDLKLIADSIIDPLSALLAVIGKEAKVKIFLQDGFKFSEKFGNNWKDKKKTKEGEIYVGIITPEMNRDFVAEIYVESLENNIFKDFLDVATAVLQYKTEEGDVSKVIKLKLNKIDEDEDLGEVDKKVEEAYYQQLAALEIKTFEKLRSQGKFKEADKNIKKFQANFTKNKYLSDFFKNKLEQVTDIKKISDLKISKQFGAILSKGYYAPGHINFKTQSNRAQGATQAFHNADATN